MKQLIVFKTGSISAKEKQKLNRSGFLAVECDTPMEAVLAIHGSASLSASELLMCALHGMSGNLSGTNRDMMVTEMHRRLKLREAKE